MLALRFFPALQFANRAFDSHPCSSKRSIITMMVVIRMVMIIVVMIGNDR